MSPTPFLLSVLLLLGVLQLHAGPTESFIVAAMRLSEQPNYSWNSTVSDDARTYDIKGKTTLGGYTRVQMPLINSLRRQLGRSVTDTQIEVIFRGNVACVIETDDGWLRPEELNSAPTARTEASRRSTARASAATATGPGRGAGAGGRAKNSQVRNQKYSNLQLGVSHPHEELAIIVSSHTELVVDRDMATGKLTDLGAQLLLVRDGQNEIKPLRGTGTFKLWLNSGGVTKYQLALEGALLVQTSAGQRTILVQQTSETRVTNIGTTEFEVPAEARERLGP